MGVEHDNICLRTFVAIKDINGTTRYSAEPGEIPCLAAHQFALAGPIIGAQTAVT